MNTLSPEFLTEEQIEKILLEDDGLKNFWEKHSPLLIFRSRPHSTDPLYEIQLVWDLGDRVETYAWIWADALAGKIIRRFPE